MRIRKLSVSMVAIPALLLAACGGGEETGDTTTDTDDTTEDIEEEEQPADDAGTDNGDDTEQAEETDDGGQAASDVGNLDCQAVEVIVPYSPGGGSDQQVRRLQPALEEILGVSMNINYQTGGDGSVGWNALHGAEPDGCTIANVVAPNIINLSMQAGEEVGFAAEDFEYLGWTEFSPNILGVAADGEYSTLEDFEAAVEEGGVTMSGVGINGELLVGEIIAATGWDVSYVPVSGGVGDIIPQIAGGHIDAAISGFSLLEGDQIVPLALSAESDEFPDVPTFEEAGYDDVQLVTSWGFIAPPDTPEDAKETWNAAIQQALQDEDVIAAYEEAGFEVLEQDLEEAQTYFEEQRQATETALAALEE